MSDTTTITPEGRATLRALATKGQSSPKNMLRALGAIAQAEARAEKTEAENARLTKMVEWLAEKHIRCAANGEQWYGPTISKELHVPMYPSKNEAIDAMKEAARRAVAAGEETCQK